MSNLPSAGGNQRARWFATGSAALFGIGVGLFLLVLVIGAQGLFFSTAPVALGAVVLALVLAAASWSRPLSKLVLCLGLPALILGVLAFAYVSILASGFAGVK